MEELCEEIDKQGTYENIFINQDLKYSLYRGENNILGREEFLLCLPSSPQLLDAIRNLRQIDNCITSIQKVYDAQLNNEIIYIKCENYQQTLRDTITRKFNGLHSKRGTTVTKFTKTEIIQVITRIICILDELHSKKIAYGIINPENILIYGNNYKLSIIGVYLDLLISIGSANNSTIYSEGYTPREMTNDYFYKDIWGIGCILYELCTQKVPFQPKKITTTMLTNMFYFPRSEKLSLGKDYSIFSKLFSISIQSEGSRVTTKDLLNELQIIQTKLFGINDWKLCFNNIDHFVENYSYNEGVLYAEFVQCEQLKCDNIKLFNLAGLIRELRLNTSAIGTVIKYEIMSKNEIILLTTKRIIHVNYKLRTIRTVYDFTQDEKYLYIYINK